jgi:hypothetical protein
VLLPTLCGISFAGDNQTAAEQTQDQGNVCYTESVMAAKGSSFPVKVFVNNIDTLAGMQVPIYYRSEDVDLKCDSVSFAGSRCEDFALNDSKIEPVGKTVYFCFINIVDASQSVQPLLPGDGLVATLWFTAPEDIKSGKVLLDSGPNAFYPHPKIDYSFLFWTPTAQQVDCTYKGGTITVK